MGDREILETYLNSASKNTLETHIFSSYDKIMLTGVTSLHYSNCQTFLTLYHNINNNAHEKLCCSAHEPKCNRIKMHF